MRTSTALKWVSGGLEAFFGIPFVGGAIILSTGWAPLFPMAILHIITLVFCVRDRDGKVGSILGIITSCLGWIPLLGMCLHIITAVVLLVSAYFESRRSAYR